MRLKSVDLPTFGRPTIAIIGVASVSTFVTVRVARGQPQGRQRASPVRITMRRSGMAIIETPVSTPSHPACRGAILSPVFCRQR